MFLEGMWNYTFYKGEEPMGSTIAENIQLHDNILLNATWLIIEEPTTNSTNRDESEVSNNGENTSEDGNNGQLEEPNDTPADQTTPLLYDATVIVSVAAFGLCAFLGLLFVMFRRK